MGEGGGGATAVDLAEAMGFAAEVSATFDEGVGVGDSGGVEAPRVEVAEVDGVAATVWVSALFLGDPSTAPRATSSTSAPRIAAGMMKRLRMYQFESRLLALLGSGTNGSGCVC